MRSGQQVSTARRFCSSWLPFERHHEPSGIGEARIDLSKALHNVNTLSTNQGKTAQSMIAFLSRFVFRVFCLLVQSGQLCVGAGIQCVHRRNKDLNHRLLHSLTSYSIILFQRQA